MSKPCIGLLGGTFDPPHEGHLQLAEHAKDQLNLEKVIFIPCKVPVHKSHPIADPTDRIGMLLALTEEKKDFIVDIHEVERETPSYTVETIEHFKRQYPEHNLCLILGSDAFDRFTYWRDYETILNSCHFFVAQRIGFDTPPPDDIRQILFNHQQDTIEDLHNNSNGCIILDSQTIPYVESTSIRDAIAAGQEPQDLPKSVWQYIIDQQLYRETR